MIDRPSGTYMRPETGNLTIHGLSTYQEVVDPDQYNEGADPGRGHEERRADRAALPRHGARSVDGRVFGRLRRHARSRADPRPDPGVPGPPRRLRLERPRLQALAGDRGHHGRGRAGGTGVRLGPPALPLVPLRRGRSPAAGLGRRPAAPEAPRGADGADDGLPGQLQGGLPGHQVRRHPLPHGPARDLARLSPPAGRRRSGDAAGRGRQGGGGDRHRGRRLLRGREERAPHAEPRLPRQHQRDRLAGDAVPDPAPHADRAPRALRRAVSLAHAGRHRHRARDPGARAPVRARARSRPASGSRSRTRRRSRGRRWGRSPCSCRATSWRTEGREPAPRRRALP